MPLRYLLDEHLRGGGLWQAIQRHNAVGTDPLDVVRVGDPSDLPLGTLDPDILLSIPIFFSGLSARAACSFSWTKKPCRDTWRYIFKLVTIPQAYSSFAPGAECRNWYSLLHWLLMRVTQRTFRIASNTYRRVGIAFETGKS